MNKAVLLKAATYEHLNLRNMDGGLGGDWWTIP